MKLKEILDKIRPWLKPIILSAIIMCIPYRIAFRSLNESEFLTIKSLFWLYDQRISHTPLMVIFSWEVFLSACVLLIPPIWFSGTTSTSEVSRYQLAFATCVIDWIAYVILVPSFLFEYSPLEEAPDPMQNLTFFVMLILLLMVIIPSLLDKKPEMNQALTKRHTILLILICLLFPVAMILPTGETFYSIRIEAVTWLILRQSILTELPIEYYSLSDFILSFQPAPTFPIGVMGWILNFLFIFQLIQYSRGYAKLKHIVLLGLTTLIPTALNNIFMVAMGFQPSSIVHFPIPTLFFVGVLIIKKIHPPLLLDTHIEEIDIEVPLLHRIRSRLWRKEKS